MTPKKSNTVTTEPTADVPLSTDFYADDADVIIRAAGTLDFRVHEFILSLASPFFKDMFTLPQPPSDTPETLPHVDVQESPKTWDNILRTIYPSLPNPIIDTLDDLQSILFAARAYEMQSVTEAHKRALDNRAFVREDPLHLFSIACGCGFEDQATYVARNAELLEISKAFDPNRLKGLTFEAYGRLVSFLAKRDHEWDQIIRNATLPYHPSCNECFSESSKARIYDRIKDDLRRPGLQTEEVYLKALEYRLGLALYCRTTSDGPFAQSVIKKFVKEMMVMRERESKKIQPAKWFS